MIITGLIIVIAIRKLQKGNVMNTDLFFKYRSRLR